MRILHTVEFYHPSVGGMQEVVRQLSERMVKMGHTVTVATSQLPGRKKFELNGVKIVEFIITGNFVNGFSGESNLYEEFLLNSDFDIITNFAAQQWATDITLPLLDKIKAKKVFVPTGFSALYNQKYAEYFRNMAEWMKKYDANVFLSDDYRDINFAREHSVSNRIIIPNGASEIEFSAKAKEEFRTKHGITEDAFLVLHLGSFTGIKGQPEAIKIFLKSNIPGSILLLIGNNNKKLKKDIYRKLSLGELIRYVFNKRRILITEKNREDTIQSYLAADVFLFPSNIECSPLVLFESMASQTPFLTSDCGNSKEIIAWSGGGELLPTTFDQLGYSHVNIEKSAEMLRSLYFDKEKRIKLANSGYTAWRERFTWDEIAKSYVKLYSDLISKS